MQLTGSQVIIECLKEQGVDTVFGYPGGAILNVYDELYKHPEIKHVLTSHEQGASHAADGYARSTGKVGVCMATSGPGATNLVTGIATAYMDSIPIVAITCNVGVSLLGKDSFQEIDIAGITTPITKYSFIVKDVTKLADTIRRAFSIARKGRPGPVLVDITKDVTANKVDYVKQEPVFTQPDCSAFTEEDLDKAIHMIEKAKKKNEKKEQKRKDYTANISQNARTNVKKISPKFDTTKLADVETAWDSEKVDPNSITAKANMVRSYDDKKNNRKKR